MAHRILLLKAACADGNADAYEQLLTEAGYTVHSLPVLSFDFINIPELSSHLATFPRFSGCVITSQRAVDAATHASALLPEWETIIRGWRELPAFVVGDSTAKSARDCGFIVVGEGSGSAAALVPIITREIQAGSKPLLYPCGNLRRDVLSRDLRTAGVCLTEVTVYETCRHPQLDDNLQAYLQSQGMPGYMTFFSPSGVRYTSDAMKRLNISPESIMTIAIGDTTKDELIRLSLPVTGVCTAPSPHALLRLLDMNHPGGDIPYYSN